MVRHAFCPTPGIRQVVLAFDFNVYVLTNDKRKLHSPVTRMAILNPLYKLLYIGKFTKFQKNAIFQTDMRICKVTKFRRQNLRVTKLRCRVTNHSCSADFKISRESKL